MPPTYPTSGASQTSRRWRRRCERGCPRRRQRSSFDKSPRTGRRFQSRLCRDFSRGDARRRRRGALGRKGWPRSPRCSAACAGRWLPLALARAPRLHACPGRKFERRGRFGRWSVAAADHAACPPGATGCHARAFPASGRRKSRLRLLALLPRRAPTVKLRQAGTSRRRAASRARSRQRRMPGVNRICGTKFRRTVGRTIRRRLGLTEPERPRLPRASAPRM